MSAVNIADEVVREKSHYAFLCSLNVICSRGTFVGRLSKSTVPNSPDHLLVFRTSFTDGIWPEKPNDGYILELFHPIDNDPPDGDVLVKYGFFIGISPSQNSAYILGFSGHDETIKDEPVQHLAERFADWTKGLIAEGFGQSWEHEPTGQIATRAGTLPSPLSSSHHLNRTGSD